MSESQSPAEVEIAGFAEKAFLTRPSGQASGAGVLFLHWFDEAPNANRTQFLAEAAELAERGRRLAAPPTHVSLGLAA